MKFPSNPSIMKCQWVEGREHPNQVTQRQHSFINTVNLEDVLWKEAGVPERNQHRREDNMQTGVRKAQDVNQSQKCIALRQQ